MRDSHRLRVVAHLFGLFFGRVVDVALTVDAEQVAGLGERYRHHIGSDPVARDHDHVPLEPLVVLVERKRPAARVRFRLVVAEQDDVVALR